MAEISPNLFLKHFANMRLFFGSVILLIFPLLGVAQNVSITGNASFYANEKIHVFNYKNQLTKEKKILSETAISKNGDYSIELDISTPLILGLKIEMRELFIHVHPNSSLVLDFLPLKNADNQRLAMIYKLRYVKKPIHTATDSVYHRIQNDFAAIQSEISSKTNVSKVYEPFFLKSDSVYQTFIQNDSLFSVFYTYFKANALLLTDIKRSKLIEEYICTNPVQYHSRAYLKFFNAILIPRINQHFIRNRKKLDEALKEYKVYESLMHLLEIDSLLENEEIRSLALLNYVRSSTANPMLTLDQKNAIIGQMANFCPFPVQKEAAQFYRKNKRALQKNSEAPIFELEDQYGQKLSLQNLRGKPVYLGFINSKSRTCYTDLMVIEQLRKKYKKAEFFMVLTDRDSVDLKQLPDEASNLNYVFLNKKYEILETYQIWSYPVYYLLDKHGYFIESPAGRPQEMFAIFEKMFANKSRRKRYEIIDD